MARGLDRELERNRVEPKAFARLDIIWRQLGLVAADGAGAVVEVVLADGGFGWKVSEEEQVAYRTRES